MPQDEAAKRLVAGAQTPNQSGKVYGEDDPYDRGEPILDHLWTRPNPNGEGVIVSAVKDVEAVGLDSVTQSRRRAVWLVLDDTIYPLNVDASQSHGLLSSGLPAEVAQRAGLPEHAVDTEATLSIEDNISFRWGGPEDPLPDCDQ